MPIMELVSALGGFALSVWTTLASQSRKDLQEERLARAADIKAGEESIAAARAFKPNHWSWYWMRFVLAMLPGMYLFILPSIGMLFMNDVQIVFGYYDLIAGNMPWDPNFEGIRWIKFGAEHPEHIYTMTPVVNMIAISVFTSVFGNQYARRG